MNIVYGNQPEALRAEDTLCLVSFDEFEQTNRALCIPARTAGEIMSCTVTKFESHSGFDFICLNLPECKYPERLCIYFKKDLLLFVYQKGGHLIENIKRLCSLETGGHVLFAFFEELICRDAEYLEELEERISALEENLLTGRQQDCTRDIVALRKRLMVLKRYYERLLDIAESIEENENGILSAKTQKFFRMYTSRVDRLYHDVLNMRDYVTQVREAYQSQVDINLNNIMKIFTVITAICMPLTLIAGWYGMNLQMPEFHLSYAYPVIIIVSLAIVVACILFFKRKKWF